MERTDLKIQPELLPIEGVSIQAPHIPPSPEELNREFATFALPLNSDIRRLIHAESANSSVQRFGKRLIDIAGALLGLLLLSPLALTLALLIRLDSRGPIFFSQTRVGKDGRLFKFYKFRSMIPNADAMKASLQKLNEIDGPAFKMKHDPRVTRLGRFLRKSSLDELPQLWNVVRGDMSLVGPRPALPEEVALWETWQYQRLAVEQGCTCIWQVSGRSDTNFKQWMQMDLEYVRTWSLGLDIALIVRTILVMLTGRGAY